MAENEDEVSVGLYSGKKERSEGWWFVPQKNIACFITQSDTETKCEGFCLKGLLLKGR